MKLRIQLMKSRTRRTKQRLLRAAISSLYGKLSGCKGRRTEEDGTLPAKGCDGSRGVSYQLLQVVLDGVGVNHDADGHQGVESKVKDLVAEKWDNPGSAQLKQTCREGFHDNRAVGKEGELMTHRFTLYAPYVAIPHISTISREMAEAMHMSEAERSVG